MGGVGAFPGLAHEGRSATRELSSCTGTAPSPPGKVPRAPWWRWSGLAPPHSQVTHKKEEKVGEAHAKREINRDKTEEGGVPDQPFLSYGVPAGIAKGKKKSPGVNASGGGCVWQGGRG